MGSHCDHPETLQQDRRILWVVLALNFCMFALEIWQGLAANSTSLIADSMDFLSDSFSYGITLYVLTRSLHMRATASLIKASLMLLLAAGVLTQGIYNILHGQIPAYTTMGWVATLALLVNVTSASLLFRSRGRDSNMQSVWLCSRNDAIANVLILIAALFVFLSGSLWPDLLAALAIAGLESTSALKIIAQAKKELRDGKSH